MKRPVVDVVVRTDDDVDVGESVKSAFNSGVRESEALVRAYARERRTLYEGGPTNRVGGVYRRVWRSPGHPALVVTVTQRVDA